MVTLENTRSSFLVNNINIWNLKSSTPVKVGSLSLSIFVCVFAKFTCYLFYFHGLVTLLLFLSFSMYLLKSHRDSTTSFFNHALLVN